MSQPHEGRGQRLLQLGRVLRPHGLTGELRVALHWESSRSLLDAAAVWLELGSEPARYEIERARPANKVILLKLRGVDDRNHAESLRDAVVLADRGELRPLASDEYYLADLVGARVEAPDGIVGRVVAVEIHPTVDTLVIENAQQERLQQPLIEHWIERIDIEQGLVLLSSREGLI